MTMIRTTCPTCGAVEMGVDAVMLSFRQESGEGSYRFLTTGDPAAFRAQGRRFLQLPIAEVEHVELAKLRRAA